MDISLIIAIIVGLVFCIGGPIVGRYASKVSHEAAQEELKNKSNLKK